MSDLDKKSQFWHDFILGIHHRATRTLDQEEWSTWANAGRTFYGEKYDALYNEYDWMLLQNEINE